MKAERHVHECGSRTVRWQTYIRFARNKTVTPPWSWTPYNATPPGRKEPSSVPDSYMLVTLTDVSTDSVLVSITVDSRLSNAAGPTSLLDASALVGLP